MRIIVWRVRTTCTPCDWTSLAQRLAKLSNGLVTRSAATATAPARPVVAMKITSVLPATQLLMS